MQENVSSAKKMITYAVLQTVVEGAILKVDGLSDVDMSKLSPYIFNGIVARVQAIKPEAAVN